MRSPDLVPVSIRMNRSFRSFSVADREEFLADLEEIAGCDRSEFGKIQFLNGCVVAKCKLPEAAFKRMSEAIQAENSPEKFDLGALQKLLKKHNIEIVELDKALTVQIASKDKHPKKAIVLIHG